VEPKFASHCRLGSKTLPKKNRMNSLRLLIVDDEPLVRDGIRHGLASLEGIDVIGECESGAQAIDVILSQHPDLVLLDVQMQNCTGLDVVRQVGPNRMPPVVFITAYDEYAVQAFELNAVDYLLKPFDEERLQQSIQRARDRIASRKQNSLAEQLQALLDSKGQKWPERIVVKSGERFDVVPVESIDWMESANNYVQLHCGAKEYFLGETLTNLEGRLNPKRFLRVHRRRIVNISRLVALHSMLGGTYELELRGGIRLTTGRQYRDVIQSLIHNNQ
jgi:two-component system LytT family response regulator